MFTYMLSLTVHGLIRISLILLLFFGSVYHAMKIDSVPYAFFPHKLDNYISSFYVEDALDGIKRIYGDKNQYSYTVDVENKYLHYTAECVHSFFRFILRSISLIYCFIFPFYELRQILLKKHQFNASKTLSQGALIVFALFCLNVGSPPEKYSGFTSFLNSLPF